MFIFRLFTVLSIFAPQALQGGKNVCKFVGAFMATLAVLLGCSNLGNLADSSSAILPPIKPGIVENDSIRTDSTQNTMPFIPMGFAPGMHTTWFFSKKIGVVSDTLFDKKYGKYGALEIAAKDVKNQFRLDHIPVSLGQKTYRIGFKADLSKGPAKLFVQFIRMVCNKDGAFSDWKSRRIALEATGVSRCNIVFDDIKPGQYIIRLTAAHLPVGTKIRLFDFCFNGEQKLPLQRQVQCQPLIDSPIYYPGETVQVGVNLFLPDNAEARVFCELKDSSGTVVWKKRLQIFTGPGRFSKSAKCLPPGVDLYVVTYSLDSNMDERFPPLVLQKCFSVIPKGDCTLMGLHANSMEDGKGLLKLGRKLGFMHYRDHDFGAFTRWSVVQPDTDCSPACVSGVFQWNGDDNIEHISQRLGYNYMGVLYDPPDWAVDQQQSRAGYPIGVPKMHFWRNYVREVVKRYSFDKRWISEWEVWNEGKGVIGNDLKDYRIYQELVKGATKEIRVLEKNGHREVYIIGFGGIDRLNIWKEILETKPQFNAVSIHWKALRYRDTYFPARRTGRITDKRFVRDGWPSRASYILKKYNLSLPVWDTEFGMLNQNHPIYAFPSMNYANESECFEKIAIADRRNDPKYDPQIAKSFVPVGPLEAAAIMAKQVVAHRTQDVTRLYIYSMLTRDFVSKEYAPQVLEYDGTLKPYLHSYIFFSKLLEKATYEQRSWPTENLVCEKFTRSDGTKVRILWNEGEGFVRHVPAPKTFIYSMFGRKIGIATDDHLKVTGHPIVVSNQALKSIISS